MLQTLRILHFLMILADFATFLDHSQKMLMQATLMANFRFNFYIHACMHGGISTLNLVALLITSHGLGRGFAPPPSIEIGCAR